jgi:hypothetical protein
MLGLDHGNLAGTAASHRLMESSIESCCTQTVRIAGTADTYSLVEGENGGIPHIT